MTEPDPDPSGVIRSSAADLPEHPDDPWAHRKGEPRIFAFLWTLYVLVCVAGSLLWLSRATRLTVGTYSPAARIMLVVVAAGMMLLWPMVRLSQKPPTGSAARAALADLFVVQLPIQMVVWPLIVLASWPLATVGAIAAIFGVWGMLIGGMLAFAFTQSATMSRTLWMVGVVVLSLGAPVLLALRWTPGTPPDPEYAMLSPLSAIPALTGYGFSGPSGPVSSAQWTILVGIGCVGVLWWGAAIALGGGSREAQGNSGTPAQSSGGKPEERDGTPPTSGLPPTRLD